MTLTLSTEHARRLSGQLKRAKDAWKSERNRRDHYEDMALAAKTSAKRAEYTNQARFYTGRMRALARQMTDIRLMTGYPGAGRRATRRA